jgi:hypothetical protein
VTIIWQAYAGKVYRVQYKDDLNGSTWSNLASDVWAVGSTASKADVPATGRRFYRVTQLN